MARIRTIKPEFWQDDDLAEVSEAAMLVAAGLLNHSDDEGFFKSNPKLIKSVVFPLREPSVSIHDILIELSNIEYISLYIGIDGKKYGHVIGFTKHQKINRPTPSKIKDLIDFTESSLSPHEVLTAGKERKGTGKGKEQGTGKGKELMPSKLDDIEKIIRLLNNLTGKKFENVESNRRLIKARIKEGHDFDKIKAVVYMKCKEWINDPKFKKYLRPATLFNAEKFNQYVGELGVETPDEKNDREMQEWINEGLDEGITEGDLYEH